MKKILVVLLLSCLALFAQQRALTLGFMPYLSSSALLQKYTPLAEYLSKELGRDVKIVIAKDYESHIVNSGKDRLDISFLGGSPYVLITDKYGPKPLLVRYEFKGKPTFRSVIITAQRSPLTSLKELRGKRFAFGNTNSTLSTQVPLFMLLQAGVELKDLKAYLHMRNHENVVYGTLFGDFDAGAVAEEVFLEKRSEGLKALAYSPRLSTHLFTTASTMPKPLRQKIRRALLKLDDPKVLQAISANLTGFVPVKDSYYDYHRAMLQTVLPILEK